jgi:hypothetical protein
MEINILGQTNNAIQLDRFLVEFWLLMSGNNTTLELNVTPLLRVGSDHNTIIVNTNEDKPPTHAIFRFETVWLSKADFKLMILSSCLTHKIDRFKTTERISRFTSRKKCKG